MEGQKHLTDWLRDAHAMEEKAETLLKRQAERLEHYPSMKARIEQHIKETRNQARRLEECINRLNGDTSAVKDFTGKFMANMEAMMNITADDEVVKDAIASYSFEHFEIACYRSLIAAAEAVGDEQTARVCREILREEEAMASWVADNITTVTTTFLDRDAAGQTAKR